MFEAAGWQTITVKYGRRLRELFARRGGEALRARIDQMPNEEYQRLLRLPSRRAARAPARRRWRAARGRAPADGAGRRGARRRRARPRRPRPRRPARRLPPRRRGQATARPSIFAYTIKAWGLPTEGHPGNHSALLSDEQWQRAGRRARRRCRSTRGRASSRARQSSRLCDASAERLTRPTVLLNGPPPVPADLGRSHAGAESTQQALRALLRRPRPRGARRRRARRHASAPTSPPRPTSAAGSTASASGTWASGSTGSPTTPTRSCAGARSEHGQHIELGIAEGNLVGLLGELGATWSRDGSALLPIGTLYDPFVNRALEPWSFGIYAGGQSILVGTPVRRHARPRGRRPPVDHHAVGRPRAAALHRLGAGLRPGPRVDAAARALSARPRRRQLFLLPAHHPPDRPGARARARRPSRARARVASRFYAAATGCAKPTPMRPPSRSSAMGAIMPEALAAAEELSGAGIGRRRRLPDLRRPRLPRAAGATGLGRRRRRHPRRAVPAGARRADRDRARRPPAHARPSSAPSTTRRSPASAFRTSGSPATWRTSTGTSASTLRTIVGAALDLIG